MTNPTTPDETNALLTDVLGAAHQPAARQNCTLTFPLTHVLTAAEHAMAAPQHALGPGETHPQPCLAWIKSDGVFLMSNGQGLTNTRDTHGQWTHIVHAQDWGPGTHPHTILGGDDIHETIHLTTTDDATGRPLIDTLRTAAAYGATHFILEVTYDNDGQLLTMITQ
ncbi:hypothetical protein OG728_39505 (plasmid) [Streptomyces microflavus]|uniref:hypothetical protein n=1 Tax=Streptomyces microflavus TaxID=1919 RepID=UPI002E0DF047|nr:hypothetical protein OG728_38260 [Streptomyces microflavus]WSR96560.1 hypothetical protein OG728_39505 [Streptomyces microflavus]